MAPQPPLPVKRSVPPEPESGRPVRIVDARDLVLADLIGPEPILIRDPSLPTVLPKRDCLHTEDGMVWGYGIGQKDADGFEPSLSCPVGEVFDAFEQGRPIEPSEPTSKGIPMNIVDFPLLPHEDHERTIPIPACFHRLDWMPHSPRFKDRCRSLVCTPTTFYTPLHADMGGGAGWMYLIEGEKHWELYPAYLKTLFYDELSADYLDPATNPPRDPGLAKLLSQLPRWTCTLKPGYIMWIPPGWLHRVWTRTKSFGCGGQAYPFGCLDEAAHFGRWEELVQGSWITNTLVDIGWLLEDLTKAFPPGEEGEGEGRARGLPPTDAYGLPTPVPDAAALADLRRAVESFASFAKRVEVKRKCFAPAEPEAEAQAEAAAESAAPAEAEAGPVEGEPCGSACASPA
eukprot:tig00020693_g13034.t1